MCNSFWFIMKNHISSLNPGNVLIQIYVNEIENRITFEIETGYSLELLIPNVLKWSDSSDEKITIYKNGEHSPNLEVFVVVLVHWNLANISFQ